jgi:hypothetical protein
MMGVFGRISRMQTVADTPSRLGMIISMRIRLNVLGPVPAWLILFTASNPSRYTVSV